MPRSASFVAVAALASIASLSIGCESSSPKRVTLNDVINDPDPTPELGNFATSDAQTRYKEAINVDHNLRGLRDDVSRFLFFKEASRLQPRAIP
jgi:hypothetical protein